MYKGKIVTIVAPKHDLTFELRYSDLFYNWELYLVGNRPMPDDLDYIYDSVAQARKSIQDWDNGKQ